MSDSRLARSSDRMIAGVAAGLANYINIDPTWMRVLFVIFLLASGGTAFIVYFVLWVILPEDDNVATVDAFDPEEIVIEDAG